MARPLAEKLRMLDALRECALAIRPTKPAPGADKLREQPPPYGKSDKRARLLETELFGDEPSPDCR